MTRALNPRSKYAEWITNEFREQAKLLNLVNLVFPTSVKDICIFEKQNTAVAANVFKYERGKKDEFVYPLRISGPQRALVVNLMSISVGEKNQYCWIKDVSQLLSS